jgi:hypothetical protein
VRSMRAEYFRSLRKAFMTAMARTDHKRIREPLVQHWREG